MTGLLIQEFKTLIKSPASISILVIPLVLLVGLGYLLPSGWIVPSSITIGIVAAVLLYFGGSIEEIKRTSFMKSISLTRLSKFTFLATKILFAMIVSMISVLWVLLFSWVFTATPIAFLATDFSNLLGNVTDPTMAVVANIPFDIHWDMVHWFAMLYAGIVTIVVAVSLSFIFVAFAKSSLSFYLMSFGYLLAMILFGGVVMPGFLISSDNSWFKNLYYVVPNYYTNNIMANAFSGGILNSVITPLSNNIMELLDVDMIGNLPEGSQAVENVSTFLASWDGTEAAAQAALDSVIASGATSEEIAYYQWTFDLLVNGMEGLSHAAAVLFDRIVGNMTHSELVDFLKNVVGLGPAAANGAAATIEGLHATGTLIPTATPIINLVLTEKVAPILVVSEGLYSSIYSILNTLQSMFGQLEWWNWPVPWLEGALFLAISIKFFKWS